MLIVQVHSTRKRCAIPSILDKCVEGLVSDRFTGVCAAARYPTTRISTNDMKIADNEYAGHKGQEYHAVQQGRVRSII